MFANREEIREEYLKLEMQLKVSTLKAYYQKQYHEQIQLICSEERIEKVSCLSPKVFMQLKQLATALLFILLIWDTD